MRGLLTTIFGGQKENTAIRKKARLGEKRKSKGEGGEVTKGKVLGSTLGGEGEETGIGPNVNAGERQQNHGNVGGHSPKEREGNG